MDDDGRITALGEQYIGAAPGSAPMFGAAIGKIAGASVWRISTFLSIFLLILMVAL